MLPADEIEVGVGVRVSGAAWACGYCGAELGSLADNYRVACVDRTRPAPEALAELGMHARAREAKRVVISEYFCAECASCVRVDVGLEGAGMAPAPQLAGGEAAVG